MKYRMKTLVELVATGWQYQGRALYHKAFSYTVPAKMYIELVNHEFGSNGRIETCRVRPEDTAAVNFWAEYKQSLLSAPASHSCECGAWATSSPNWHYDWCAAHRGED